MFDPCLLGMAHRGGEFVAVYSRKKIIDALIAEDEDLSEEDAIDHYEFNVSGSAGLGFPMFMLDDDER